MQSSRNRTLRLTLQAIALPLLLLIGIAAGVGQYRRVTNDVPHDIDRFQKMLGPIRQYHFESLEFYVAPGRLATLPQARLVMAPTLLRHFNETPLDTLLAIRPKTNSPRHGYLTPLWQAEDEVYIYELFLPPNP
jgi:hypothetical protein